jgi:hypothetical protein
VSRRPLGAAFFLAAIVSGILSGVLWGLLGLACATSGAADKNAGSPSCERGVCARIIERSLSNRIEVELTAPASASLHNAWVAEPGVLPCRGGRTLNAVSTDAGVRVSGPLAIAGATRVVMTFTLRFSDGSALDLDVRSPEGAICLRVPFAAAAGDGGPVGDGGRG